MSSREFNCIKNGELLGRATARRTDEGITEFEFQETFEIRSYLMESSHVTNRHRLMADLLYLNPQPEKMPVLDLDARPHSDDDICFVMMCPPEFRQHFNDLTNKLRQLDLGFPEHVQEAQRLITLAAEGIKIAKETSGWERRAASNEALPEPRKSSDADCKQPMPVQNAGRPTQSSRRRLRRLSASVISLFSTLILRS